MVKLRSMLRPDGETLIVDLPKMPGSKRLTPISGRAAAAVLYVTRPNLWLLFRESRGTLRLFGWQRHELGDGFATKPATGDEIQGKVLM